MLNPLSMFDQIIAVLDAISKIAIFITLIAFYLNMRQTRRVNYMTCTAKYTSIQQIFLTNKHLAPLHLSIYGNKLNGIYRPEPEAAEEKPSKAEKFNAELALSAMLFQLMEDVWTVNLARRNSWFLTAQERANNDEVYKGWDNLFRDWMATPEISEKWQILKTHYNTRFVDDTEMRYRTGDD